MTRRIDRLRIGARDFGAHLRQRWYLYLPVFAIWGFAYTRLFIDPTPRLPVLFNWTPSLPCRVALLQYGPNALKRGDYVVFAFDGEAQALRIANGTDFGLVAGVWTRDGGRALRMVRKLQCGQVFVNNYGAGGGIELPFGGVKHSGHGREKGFEALYGFSSLKTIAIKHD